MELRRGKNVPVRRINNQQVDIDTIKKSITDKTKLIIIDNPSNPFGCLTTLEEIEELLKTEVITVIDEAYFGYCDVTATSLLNKYPNLIILRTFSKIMGMAGARIAYSICSEEIFHSLVKIKVPHQVNIIAQFLAKEILQSPEIEKRIRILKEGREYLIEQMRKLDFIEVFNSEGAYIVFKSNTDKISTEEIKNSLYKKKLMIKKMDFPDLEGDFLRINVVSKELAEQVIDTLKELQ